MNGGGGHEESVTWVLAEAERGMLVHCCCFVVNLVRGDTAARLLDALHALCQVTPSAVWETYSGRFYAFRSTDTRVHRGEVVFLFFLKLCREDVLTFLLKLCACAGLLWRWHYRSAQISFALVSCLGVNLDPRVFLSAAVDFVRLFQWRGHVLCWSNTITHVTKKCGSSLVWSSEGIARKNPLILFFHFLLFACFFELVWINNCDSEWKRVGCLF